MFYSALYNRLKQRFEHDEHGKVFLQIMFGFQIFLEMS